MTKLLHPELTYYLRGLGFQIHNELGAGHAEADYETALAFSLDADSVAFRQQPIYRIDYCGRQIGEYRPDIVIDEGKILLELKVAPSIEPLHKAQTLSYLKLTGSELGLIMNFGASSMQYERLPNFMESRNAQVGGVAMRENLLYQQESRAILDALQNVHSALGPGFLHQVYRRAVRIELPAQGLAAAYLKELPLRFRDIDIGMKAVRLFLVERKVLLATIAVKQITAEHTEKMRWAMRVTECRLGLIANFHGSTLAFRFLRTG